MKLTNIKMTVIPEPAEGTRAVMIPESVPVFEGQGNVNYVCGNCPSILAKHMFDDKQISNLVIRCYSCGSYNDIP